MKHEYQIEYEDLLLRQIKEEDIENLRNWRNEKEETKYLRPIGIITREMQKNWYEKYLLDNTEITFSIVEKKKLNRMVGSVSLHDIKFEEKICEVGKIRIGEKQAHGLGIGKKALVMCIVFAFEKLKFNKVVGNVHKDNFPACKNDIDIGFQIKGVHPSVAGGEEFYLKITKERLYKVNEYAKNIYY